jgi:hypothetical protein
MVSWWKKCLSVNGKYVEVWWSDVCHLLPMCLVYIEVIIKLLLSECVLPYIFNIFLY